MRTCDICQTTIPFGTNICPNCGYRYKKEKYANGADKEYKQGVNSRFVTHPEMKVDKVNKKNYMNQFKQHPYDSKKFSSSSVSTPKKKKSFFKKLILFLVSLVMAACFGIGVACYSYGIRSIDDAITAIENIKESKFFYRSYNTLEHDYKDAANTFYEPFLFLTNSVEGYGIDKAYYQNYEVEKKQLVSGEVRHRMNVEDGNIRSVIILKTRKNIVTQDLCFFPNNEFILQGEGIQYILDVLGLDYNDIYETLYEAFQEYKADGYGFVIMDENYELVFTYEEDLPVFSLHYEMDLDSVLTLE